MSTTGIIAFSLQLVACICGMFFSSGDAVGNQTKLGSETGQFFEGLKVSFAGFMHKVSGFSFNMANDLM